MTKLKTTEKVLQTMTVEEVQNAFYRAQNDPAVRFLNEVCAVDTQKEVADLLAKHRDFLQGLPTTRRKEVMQQVNEMIEEKPVV